MLLELDTGIQAQLSLLTRQKGAILVQVSTENAIRKTTTTLIFVKYYRRKLEMTFWTYYRCLGVNNARWGGDGEVKCLPSDAESPGSIPGVLWIFFSLHIYWSSAQSFLFSFFICVSFLLQLAYQKTLSKVVQIYKSDFLYQNLWMDSDINRKLLSSDSRNEL